MMKTVVIIDVKQDLRDTAHYQPRVRFLNIRWKDSSVVVSHPEDQPWC